MDFARGFEPSIGKGAGSLKGGTVVPIELTGWTTNDRKCNIVLELEAKAADQMAKIFAALKNPDPDFGRFEGGDVSESKALANVALRILPLETDVRYLQQPSSEGNDDKGLFVSLWYGSGIRLSAMFDLYMGQAVIRSFRLNWRDKSKPREITLSSTDCAVLLSLVPEVRSVLVSRILSESLRTGDRPKD